MKLYKKHLHRLLLKHFCYVPPHILIGSASFCDHQLQLIWKSFFAICHSRLQRDIPLRQGDYFAD